jgi:hypothetical protein
MCASGVSDDRFVNVVASFNMSNVIRCVRIVDDFVGMIADFSYGTVTKEIPYLL